MTKALHTSFLASLIAGTQGLYLHWNIVPALPKSGSYCEELLWQTSTSGLRQVSGLVFKAPFCFTQRLCDKTSSCEWLNQWLCYSTIFPKMNLSTAENKNCHESNIDNTDIHSSVWKLNLSQLQEFRNLRRQVMKDESCAAFTLYLW